MSNLKIKEMLEKQLQLLFEHSKNSICDADLIGLTSEMVKVAEFLRSF